MLAIVRQGRKTEDLFREFRFSVGLGIFWVHGFGCRVPPSKHGRAGSLNEILQTLFRKIEASIVIDEH